MDHNSLCVVSPVDVPILGIGRKGQDYYLGIQRNLLLKTYSFLFKHFQLEEL